MEYFSTCDVDEFLQMVPKWIKTASEEQKITMIQLIIERMISHQDKCPSLLFLLQHHIRRRLPHDLFVQLLELLYIIPECTLDILHTLPHLLYGTEFKKVSLVFQHIMTILKTDRSLLVPAIGVFGALPLSKEQVKISVDLMLNALDVVDEGDTGTIVKSLLCLMNTSNNKIIASAIQNTGNHNINRESLYLLMDLVTSTVQVNKIALVGFLTIIETNDTFLLFDVLFLLMLWCCPVLKMHAKKGFMNAILCNKWNEKVVVQTCDILKSSSWCSLREPFLHVCEALSLMALRVLTVVDTSFLENLLQWIITVAEDQFLHFEAMEHKAFKLLLRLSTQTEGYAMKRNNDRLPLAHKTMCDAVRTICCLSQEHTSQLQRHGHVLLDHMLCFCSTIEDEETQTFICESLSFSLISLSMHDAGLYAAIMMVVQKNLFTTRNSHWKSTSSSSSQAKTRKVLFTIICHLVIVIKKDSCDRIRLLDWVLRALPYEEARCSAAAHDVVRVGVLKNAYVDSTWLDKFTNQHLTLDRHILKLMIDGVEKNSFSFCVVKIVKSEDVFRCISATGCSSSISNSVVSLNQLLKGKLLCYLAIYSIDNFEIPSLTISPFYTTFCLEFPNGKDNDFLSDNVLIMRIGELLSLDEHVQLCWTLIEMGILSIEVCNWIYHHHITLHHVMLNWIPQMALLRYHTLVLWKSLKNRLLNKENVDHIRMHVEAMTTFIQPTNGNDVVLLHGLCIELAQTCCISTTDGFVRTCALELLIQSSSRNIVKVLSTYDPKNYSQVFHDLYDYPDVATSCWATTDFCTWITSILFQNDNHDDVEEINLILILIQILKQSVPYGGPTTCLGNEKFHRQNKECIVALAAGCGQHLEKHCVSESMYDEFQTLLYCILLKWKKTTVETTSSLLIIAQEALTNGSKTNAIVLQMLASSLQRVYPHEIEPRNEVITHLLNPLSNNNHGIIPTSMFSSNEGRGIRWTLLSMYAISGGHSTLSYLETIVTAIGECSTSDDGFTEHTVFKGLCNQTAVYYFSIALRCGVESLSSSLQPNNNDDGIEIESDLFGPFSKIGSHLLFLNRALKMYNQVHGHWKVQSCSSLIHKSMTELVRNLSTLLKAGFNDAKVLPRNNENHSMISCLTLLVEQVQNVLLVLEVLIQKKSISRKRKSKTSWADLKTIKTTTTFQYSLEKVRHLLNEYCRSRNLSLLRKGKERVDRHATALQWYTTTHISKSSRSLFKIADKFFQMQVQPKEWEIKEIVYVNGHELLDTSETSDIDSDLEDIIPHGEFVAFEKENKLESIDDIGISTIVFNHHGRIEI